MKHFESIHIKEGVRLHFLPDYKFKTFRISAFFHCPLRKETASLDALLPSVLKRGTKQYPTAQELSLKLEELYGASLGGAVNKRGDSHIISFHFESVSSEFLPEDQDMFSVGAELFFEFLLHPNCDGQKFPEDIVSQEKENLKKDIEGIKNDKRSYAVFRAIQEMFMDEPYGTPTLGSIEQVEKINGRNLYEHYEKMISAAPVDIFVLGNFNSSIAQGKIKELCEQLKARSGTLIPSTLLKKTDQPQTVQESMNIVQGKLVLGFTTEISGEEEDYYSLLVMNSIFGSGTHSKLFNNVREKMSLAYYVASRLDKFKGVMLVDSGIEFGNYQKTVDEIHHQLDEMKKGNIKEVEFDSAVEGLANAYRSMKDSMHGIEQFYFGQIHQDEIDTPENMIEKIKAVTVEDVVRVANKIHGAIVYFLKD